MSFLTGSEMKELYRSPAEKTALGRRLTEMALKHSNTCICGVCRHVFPECYAQCDVCDAWSLKEDTHGLTEDSPCVWCDACEVQAQRESGVF